MSDNIDVFKSIIFSVPSTKKVFLSILGFSALLGLLLNLSLSYFTNSPFNFEYLVVSIFFIFMIPALLSGELYSFFLPDYKRKWAYFLSFFNEFVLFFYGIILVSADGFVGAWNVFWLAIITIFLTSLIALLSTLGYGYIKEITLLSLVQPSIIVVAFHLYIGRGLSLSYATYLEKFGVLFLAGSVLIIILGLSEYLIGTNVDVSALRLLSGLIQKKQEVLDLGYFVLPDVQTLSIENDDGDSTVAVPWIHPGPLEGFGGGRASTDIINHLNDDGEGFFFHVPSTHKSDPANPDDINKIIDALKNPEKNSKTSKMIQKSYNGVKFYGRKIGDQKIVFMEAEGFGDYEIPVFKEILDLEKVMIIDLHNHIRNKEPDSQLAYDTEESYYFREKLKDFLKELENLEMHEYKVGFSVDCENIPKFALVEKTNNQKTLIFGTEGNGISEEMEEIKKEYNNKYDKILVLTTDTHSSIHKMTANKHIKKKRMRKTIEKANKNKSKGKIGFTNQKAEPMKLLKDDYLGLTYSINILARLVPLTLLLLYLGLILWII